MLRHEYHVTSDAYIASGRAVPDGWVVRAPLHDDLLELASLMMDAYVGTIDYEGETLEQAIEEVDGYFAGEAYLEVSRVAVEGDIIQAAALVSRVAGLPLVGYVMTRADVKGRGLASALLDVSMTAAWEDGCDHIRAFITAGNTPSDIIFKRAGFEVIGTYGED